MRDSYPSDISREQFEPLQAIFEQSKQQTKRMSPIEQGHWRRSLDIRTICQR